MALKFSKPKYRHTVAITIYLQIILWGSLIGLVASLSDIVVASVDITLRPAAILLFVSSFLSIVYLIFHTITARRRVTKGYKEDPASLVKRPAYILTRLTISMVMSWLITSGWNLIIAAREPICLPGNVIAAYWEAGGPCIAQRFGTAVAIFLLIVSCALFTTLEMSHDPLKSHLFGITRDPSLSVTIPRASIHQQPFPRPGGLAEKWNRSPIPHSRNPSDSSLTLQGSVRAGPPDEITVSPMTPAMTGTTLGLGSATTGVRGLGEFPVERPGSGNASPTRGLGAVTMGTRGLGEFPVERPGTGHNSPSRGSTSPTRGSKSPIRGSTSPIRGPSTSPPRTPAPARVLRTSHSTTSLASSAAGRSPYRHKRNASSSTILSNQSTVSLPNFNNSSLSLPGFTPLMPLRPPPVVSTTDSAWRAVHPPAHQFQHVSSSAPYVPFAPKTVQSGVPVTYGNVRAVSVSKGLGLGGSRAPSLQGGQPGNPYHARGRSGGSGASTSTTSLSSSSHGSNAVAAWVGTQQRSALNQMSRPGTSDTRPGTSDSGAGRMSGALSVDAMLGPPPQRAQDLDLAIKLERKLQEVQAKLERQASDRSLGSKSSYSIGEIERAIDIDAGMGVTNMNPFRGKGKGKEDAKVVVGGKSFDVQRGVDRTFDRAMETGGASAV